MLHTSHFCTYIVQAFLAASGLTAYSRDCTFFFGLFLESLMDLDLRSVKKTQSSSYHNHTVSNFYIISNASTN